MKGFICIMSALLAAAALHRQYQHIQSLQADLAVARAVSEERRAALEISERTLAEWAQDRITLEAVQQDTRRALSELMKNEKFSAWGSTAVPAGAWGLLSQSPDRQAATSRRADHALSANGSTGGGN